MKISFWRIFWPTLIAVIVASIIGIFSFLGILGGVVASLSAGDNEEEKGQFSVLNLMVRFSKIVKVNLTHIHFL